MAIAYRLSCNGPSTVPSHCAYDDEPMAEGCWAFTDTVAVVLATLFDHTQDGNYRPVDGYHHLQIIEEGELASQYEWCIVIPSKIRVVNVEAVHAWVLKELGEEDIDELCSERVRQLLWDADIDSALEAMSYPVDTIDVIYTMTDYSLGERYEEDFYDHAG